MRRTEQGRGEEPHITAGKRPLDPGPPSRGLGGACRAGRPARPEGSLVPRTRHHFGTQTLRNGGNRPVAVKVGVSVEGRSGGSQSVVIACPANLRTVEAGSSNLLRSTPNPLVIASAPSCRRHRHDPQAAVRPRETPSGPQPPGPSSPRSAPTPWPGRRSTCARRLARGIGSVPAAIASASFTSRPSSPRRRSRASPALSGSGVARSDQS